MGSKMRGAIPKASNTDHDHHRRRHRRRHNHNPHLGLLLFINECIKMQQFNSTPHVTLRVAGQKLWFCTSFNCTISIMVCIQC